jgi:hypothetical protein
LASGHVSDISSANHSRALDWNEKNAVANRVIAAMKNYIAQVGATDCSRLAWLYLRVGDLECARRLTPCAPAERFDRRDHENQHRDCVCCSCLWIDFDSGQTVLFLAGYPIMRSRYSR